MIETKFKDSELGLIPEDWEENVIGSIGEPIMCRRILKSQTTSTGDIPFYKIGTFGKIADSYINASLWRYLITHYHYPKNGDVLLSAAGTIGRCVKFDGSPSYYQDSNIVWIDNDESKLKNSLLYYLYSSLNWNVDSSTISRLYNSNLKSTKIVFPNDLDEQERIAEALNDVDALIKELDALIEKKRMVLKATMQDLLTARRRLPGFSDPWQEVKLGELVNMNSGGTPSTSNHSYYSGIIPFLSISDISSAGKFLYKTQKHISDDAVLNSSARVFPKDTLLISMYASIGKCIISKIDVAISQAILGFVPKKNDFNTDYLYYTLLFNNKELISSGQTGTQSNLNKRIVQNFSVSIPSDIAEQTAISDICSDMDAEIAELEKKKEKYTSIRQGMMQQLLTGKIRLI